MKRALSASLPLSALAAGVALTASLAMAKPAEAFTISFNPQFGSTENTGATADLNFNFVQEANNLVRLNLNLTNTTNGTVGLGATSATLVGFAFDVVSGVTFNSFSAGSSNFTKSWQNVALQPFGTFDLGVSTPRNSFAGGNANNGLTAGQTTMVSFLLNSSLSAAQVESDFLAGFTNGTLGAVARFQQVNAGGGSDKVLGGVTSNSEAVPEPATILGAIAAGGALFGGKKLKDKAKA
ncbi:hypothetical protein ACN4EK_12855 [Pantanalinema rosaneae CENA516]|uniref:hypothetical protein n=1 Tax=Pantanalinema rosaneae TaxID=1620701 RepID=UPI003D6FB275